MGIAAGLLSFHISQFLLVQLFELIDNSFFSGSGGFSIVEQIIYTSLILNASALSVLVSTTIASTHKRTTAQITSIIIGLWFGVILWFISFSVIIISVAILINYFFSLMIGAMSFQFLDFIKKHASSRGSSQNI